MNRWAVLVAIVLAAGTARGDEAAARASAREIFYQASAAMKAGYHARAKALFARSYALYPTPTGGLGEARALVQLGRLVEARERYRAIVNLPLGADASDAFREAVSNAEREAAAVEKKLAALVIVVDGSA